MQSTTTRSIVYAGLVAATYAVITYALSPISFGPLQFRVATMLFPIVLLDKKMALGIAFGVGLANLFSPFGWYDFLLMPIAAYAIGRMGCALRASPNMAIVLMSAGTAVTVAVFPLWMGGGIPVWPTVLLIFVSTIVAELAGWHIIWRRFPPFFCVDKHD